MITAVRDTSVAAYHGMRPRLGAQQQVIVTFLAKHAHRDFTRGELARALFLPVSTICGRCAELLKLHVIEEGPRRPDRGTGISAHPIRLMSAQQDLFAA